VRRLTDSCIDTAIEEYARVMRIDVINERFPEYLWRNKTSMHLFEKCVTIAINK
jgi:hypothetical protein